MKRNLTTIFMAVVLCIALTAVTKTTQAQNGRFSVGAEIGLPMSSAFKKYNGLGIGGTLRYEYPVSDALAIGAGAGYITFAGKDSGPKFNVIPFQAFAKYYFGGEAQDGIYGMVDLGMTNGKSSASGAKSSTKLSYAPELGYHLTNIDLGLRYQMVTADSGGETLAWLGIRLAYVFGEK